MITHFAQLELNTVSVQGVKQFYHDQLCLPILRQSDDEIHFRLTDYTVLSFKESHEPLAPAHIAFEVPASEFEHALKWLQNTGVTLLKWADGRIIDNFDTGKNVYFRDGDGNLLEIISHTYVKEGIVSPAGELKVLYLREIGFPVDSVIDFRKLLVDLFNFKLAKVYDNFTFAIGGTAHAVITSKKRKWVPISMAALPPSMKVSFGVSSSAFVDRIKTNLASKSIPFESTAEGQLHFKIYEYSLSLTLTDFPEEAPSLLDLPFSK